MSKLKERIRRRIYYRDHKSREVELCRQYHMLKRKELLFLTTAQLIEVFNRGSRYYGAKNYIYSRYNGYQIKLHRLIYAVATGCTLQELEGFDIHHMDGHIHNNTFQNLECLSPSKHLELRRKDV